MFFYFVSLFILSLLVLLMFVRVTWLGKFSPFVLLFSPTCNFGGNGPKMATFLGYFFWSNFLHFHLCSCKATFVCRYFKVSKVVWSRYFGLSNSTFWNVFCWATFYKKWAFFPNLLVTDVCSVGINEIF